MSFYENVFIVRQEVSTTQIDTLIEKLTDVVNSLDGKVVNHEYWGSRLLAYRINRNRKGHYVMLNLDCPPNALKELERKLRLDEDIIRFMTIRVKGFSDEPSIMMLQKNTDKPEKTHTRNRRDYQERQEQPSVEV